MRFSAAALLLCLGAAVALVSAQDDFDYGDDTEGALDEKPEVKPLPPASRRPALPTAARKSPLSRSRTPVTPPPPPPPSPPPVQEVPESEEEEFAEEGDNAPVTEASTKKPLLRGGVRPFRSNQDLLETLKRRRQNIRVSTHAPEDTDEESASQAPSPSSTSSRRRFNNGRSASKAPAASPEAEESKAASKPSTRNGRRFSGRGRVVEEEEQPAVVEEPKSRTGRRRF